MSATPAYPLPRPANNDDPRFNLGLALDVAESLTRHGYPPLTAGVDLVRLQQALFSLIYQPNNTSDQPLDKPSSIGNQIPPSRQQVRGHLGPFQMASNDLVQQQSTAAGSSLER
jgi:hypothetical protein